ncbi:MAG: peptidoglycan-associated lipoprotein Pal [Verrucomicrobia bacterium]|nr:peptidoglycan-associated lipoprotein Pal [Verrucomicrobiota bacterium]
MVAFTGCKSKKPTGAGDGMNNIAGIGEGDIYAQPLGERFEGGSEYAGQFEAVLFAYDSAQVQPSERGKLEAVADNLRRNPQTGVIIEGHCDERGSREYNLALGERRALAARAYLVGLGIDTMKIQTKSYGEEQPVAMGHDESSWSRNRRAEFVLFY